MGLVCSESGHMLWRGESACYDCPMDITQIIILALLQGATEFLPVSSSAHLILVPRAFGWPDQGLAFDVAVHLGALAAVVVYFRRSLGAMARGCVRGGGERRLGVAVLLGTVPVVVVGGLARDIVAGDLRAPVVIAAATIIFGLLLLFANRPRADAVDEYRITPAIALLIGAAQTLALAPGASRSGVTMTAAVMLGLSQAAAARFSFLLSMPVIAGSAVFEIARLARQPLPADWHQLALGAALSALSAFACIHLFLRLIERVGFTPFVVYRLALGAILLFVFSPAGRALSALILSAWQRPRPTIASSSRTN